MSDFIMKTCQGCGLSGLTDAHSPSDLCKDCEDESERESENCDHKGSAAVNESPATIANLLRSPEWKDHCIPAAVDLMLQAAAVLEAIPSETATPAAEAPAKELCAYIKDNIRLCDHGYIHITCGQCVATWLKG